jgi:hypothetical protein
MTSVALPAKVNPNVDATSEDALFMVVVRSKDSEDASDTLPTFQAVMPADSVVACDARGGLAARRPSSVQLLTRDRVSIALYSSTLDAAAVVDGFVSRRDAHRDDPRARANALRVFLRDLKNQGHCFTLAAFDESRRALAAWTPRSAPMSFGHARDGAVVLVASAPRARSLVGEHLAGDDDVTLAHLPAGRFVYGHGYLRPFEFTELWSSARGNRAGTVARAQNVDPNLDKPKLSPEDGKKWRWEKTGSRAEQADRWTKKVTKETVAAATKSTSPALSAASTPFVAAKQKASSIVEKPTTLPGALFTFAVGAVAHAKLRAGLSRVNRYDTRADKRFLTLLLLRLAVFVEKKPSAGVSQRLEAMAEAMAPEEKEVAVEEGAVRLGVAAARAPAAVAKAALSAVRFATAAAPKRRSKLVHSALVRGSAASRGGLQSSVVVCDLNGRCCIGNHCFVG